MGKRRKLTNGQNVSGKGVKWGMDLNQAIDIPMNEDVAPSSSQVDFLANLSVVPGSEEARKMTVTSGRKCYAWFPKQSPVGLLAKMLLASSAWASTTVFLTWKIKATKSKRLYFQLAPSVPRTEGTGCGLLPVMLKTPSAVETEGGVMEVRENVNAHYKLRDQIAMLPTPRAEKHSPQSREDFTPNLAARIQMLPTPRASMKKGPSEKELNEGDPKGRLETRVGLNHGLKLQPAFVEWMMGYPEGWTELID
jgi:hypothetical protein